MNRRLAPIVVPVCLLGLGSVLLAAWSFATTSHSVSMLLGVVALRAGQKIHYDGAKMEITNSVATSDQPLEGEQLGLGAGDVELVEDAVAAEVPPDDGLDLGPCLELLPLARVALLRHAERDRQKLAVALQALGDE